MAVNQYALLLIIMLSFIGVVFAEPMQASELPEEVTTQYKILNQNPLGINSTFTRTDMIDPTGGKIFFPLSITAGEPVDYDISALSVDGPPAAVIYTNQYSHFSCQFVIFKKADYNVTVWAISTSMYSYACSASGGFLMMEG